MSSKIAVDFETYLITPGCNTPRPICLAIFEDKKSTLYTRHEHADKILAALKRALTDENVLLVGHNIIFDFAVACAEWPELIPLVFECLAKGRVWDNMIVELLYNMAYGEIDFRSVNGERVASGYGLADLAKRWLGERVEKEDTWRLRYPELDYVPLAEWPEEARAYPLGDVDVPFRTQAAQQAAIVEEFEQSRMPDHAAQHRAAWWMYLMSTWGVRTNAEAVRALQDSIEKEMSTLVHGLLKSGVLKEDLKRDMKKIREYVIAGYTAQGLAECVPTTDGGAISTAEETLAASKHPALETLGQYVHLQKMLNTYVLGKGKKNAPGVGLVHGIDGPICARYRVLVATGRTSCSKPNCFSGDTEVLTPDGWVAFHQLRRDQLVAQWNNGVASFVQPTNYIAESGLSDGLRLSNQHIDLNVTPDHRCLLRHRKTGELRVFSAAEYPTDWQQLHAGFLEADGSVDLSAHELTILCAVQADGHYADSGINFSFRKHRKISRLLVALSALDVPHTIHEDARGQARIRLLQSPFVEQVMHRLGPKKLLGSWILRLSRERLDQFCEEVFLWDGCVTRMNHYSSNQKSNADWVQTALVLSGKRANVRIYQGVKNLNYQVDVTHRDYGLTTNIEREPSPLYGVYCVSVPSSYLFIRRNGKVVVTGNCQNPPREGGIRECFEARKGFSYVGCDYDTAELRALAEVVTQKVGYSVLGDIIRAGKDPHLMFAAQLMGREYDDVFKHRKEKAVKEMRQIAKAANFGYPGGLGAESFVAFAKGYGIELTLVESQRLRDAWFKAFPEMKKYFELIAAEIGSIGEGTIRTLGSGRIHGARGFCQAANLYFQGMVADGAKRAGWFISYECYVDETSPLFGSRIAMFLHDEFILEVPLEKVHAAAKRLEELMIIGMSHFIKVVPVTCTAAAMFRWYKGSEPVFVDGKLVPGKPVEVDGETKWVEDERIAA